MVNEAKTLKEIYSRFKIMNENEYNQDNLEDTVVASSMNTITDEQWNNMTNIVDTMYELLEGKPSYNDLLALVHELNTLEVRIDEAIIDIERHN
tara:strand:+ start:134 stop:415 length:282 start_codon:yes stop_codon:yes gene_type:complete